MSSLLHQISGAWHRISPFLGDVPAAVKAVLGNQAYPARTLLITLAVIAAVIVLAVKLIGALRQR